MLGQGRQRIIPSLRAALQGEHLKAVQLAEQGGQGFIAAG